MITRNHSDHLGLGSDSCLDRAVIVPLINHFIWFDSVRISFYFFGMIWCFFGIAIVTDILMCSIQKITGQVRAIKVASSESDYEEIEVRVWNDTVANLTMMALGSNAPEIVLAFMEIAVNNFNAGDFGPGTIIGSAAFNTFCVIGMCVISMPKGKSQMTGSGSSFVVTAFFSLFAHVWLVLVLSAFSPNYVELWEALMTLLFCPLVVTLAYMYDEGFLDVKKEKPPELELGLSNDPPGVAPVEAMNERATSEFIKELVERIGADAKELRKIYPDVSEEQIAQLATKKLIQEMPHNRLWYRINAVRGMVGGQKLQPQLNDHLLSFYKKLMKKLESTGEKEKAAALKSMLLTKKSPSVCSLCAAGDLSEQGTKAVIEFTASCSAVMENDGSVKIYIKRSGRTDNRVPLKIETIDGTAVACSDYVPLRDTIVFESEEVQKIVEIKIIDDSVWEPTEVFFLKLSLDPDDAGNSVLGPKSVHEVTIYDDDEPGTFEFSKPSMLVKESCGIAHIPVVRKNGADGKVAISWKTEDMSALAGSHYEGTEGVLTFEHGETRKTIEFPIYDIQEGVKDRCFEVGITQLPEGSKPGRILSTIVTIVNDDDFQIMVNRLVNMTNMNMDALRVESTSWGDQFKNAMNVNGGDVENASALDYVLHFICFGFKVVFAFIPPPGIMDGWLAFFMSLGMIALLVTLVADLAAIFSCLLGLKNSITAITFLAVGTSLPDLFASRTAAIQERTVDHSISHVTASNCLNVFFGLGVPWVVATSYWKSKGQDFYYSAGSVSFSSFVYGLGAVLTAVLFFDRYYLSTKKDVIVPWIPKLAFGGVLFSFWVLFVTLSSLQAYGHIKSPF